MATFLKMSSNTGGPLLPGDILINTSTFRPAHCGIVITAGGVIHATNDGVVESVANLWGSQADVFRPRPDLTADQVKKLVKIAFEIKGSAEYGLSRAVFKSTFGSGAMGPGAETRLAKYRERLKSNQGVVKNVYCSELVILCYQLAWMNGDVVDKTDRHFIPLDGCHTWPSTLRRYLNSNPTYWASLGTVDP